ncbi:hypothetical protein [Mucilaginibacter sp. dw_454]|uniref:hypothetical protein n=1 Tax=Mucilaginibacter sp. dw_454 TaxID=2720079 RepID=UPI001BD65BDB|nr:hypothetical protein [Mucilaginibacter sp. dw_454]
MLKTIKIKLAAYLVTLIVFAFYGTGFCNDTLRHAAEPDKALLAKFELLCKKMRDIKGNYTLGGIIDINDKANPADRMNHVSFLFCKQADEFYYQLGKTVTLNEQGVYLCIDYGIKRIMFSRQKTVNYDTGLKQFADIGATIRSENYQLSSKITGDEQTISLINERHITCKQYALTFNRRNMKIKRLYMRLSNFNDPLRTGNEKIVDVSINTWDNTADVTRYLSKNNVIEHVNGTWKTTKEFKDYQLIKTDY